MAYIYISLVVLGITTVAYLARHSAKKGVSSFDLTFAMFAAASVLGFFFAKLNNVEIAYYTVELCSISMIAGVGGVTAVFVFNNAVRMGHFGYSNAIYRSSFLIPVITSVMIFRSHLSMTSIIGISFILISIFLVSWSNDAFTKVKDKSNLRWFLVIICAFVLSGLPRIGQLLISQNGLNSFAYLFASCTTGFILFLIISIFRQNRLNTLAFLYGCLAAFASYMGVYCTIEALKLLPSAIVFPITLSAPIMLGMFISFICRERIRSIGLIGISIGICGILILSLQIYIK